jgi:hypothetical protein
VQGRRQAVTATFEPKKLCALMLMMMWVQCHVRQRLLLHHQLIFKRSSRPPHATVHAHLLRCFLLLSRSHASQIIPHLSSETFPPPTLLSLSLCTFASRCYQDVRCSKLQKAGGIPRMQCTTTAKQHGSTAVSSHNPTTCVAATAQVIAFSPPILLLLLLPPPNLLILIPKKLS